jgi:hypothetical protein
MVREGPMEPVILSPEVLLGNFVLSRCHAFHSCHARNWLDPAKIETSFASYFGKTCTSDNNEHLNTQHLVYENQSI